MYRRGKADGVWSVGACGARGICEEGSIAGYIRADLGAGLERKAQSDAEIAEIAESGKQDAKSEEVSLTTRTPFGMTDRCRSGRSCRDGGKGVCNKVSNRGKGLTLVCSGRVQDMGRSGQMSELAKVMGR